MATPADNLKLAKRGPIVSITAYISLTLAKLVTGYILNSSSLVADGFNNLSDILGNLALLIGLHLASRPADEDHRFGHWKIEDLSSLITSFIMFIVGFQVLIQTIKKILSPHMAEIDPLGAIVGIISALVMFGVYLFNKTLSQKVKSSALVAARRSIIGRCSEAAMMATDVPSDVRASDRLSLEAAIVITYFILKTAYDIFMQSAFSLSDGFDQKQLKEYEAAILQIPKISAVKSQRGRTYGSNVYLDIVLEMNPDLSVYESHAITEEVEKLLSKKFSVYDIDIHVEPASIPEDEVLDNVSKKLYKNEKIILSKIPDYEDYISKSFLMIDKDGHFQNATEFLKEASYSPCNFKYFKIHSISQKTKLLTYELNGERHTSIWRRHEVWYLIFHQVTKISYQHFVENYHIVSDRHLNKK